MMEYAEDVINHLTSLIQENASSRTVKVTMTSDVWLVNADSLSLMVTSASLLEKAVWDTWEETALTVFLHGDWEEMTAFYLDASLDIVKMEFASHADKAMIWLNKEDANYPTAPLKETTSAMNARADLLKDKEDA